MEALGHSMGLRALGLGAAVVDVLAREIKLVLVPFRVAAIFRASIGRSLDGLGQPGFLAVDHRPGNAGFRGPEPASCRRYVRLNKGIVKAMTPD